MKQSAVTIIFGMIMLLTLVMGVVRAWGISRADPSDSLRSTRLRYLSYAVAGMWLLVLPVGLFIPSGTSDGVVRNLLLAAYVGLPLAAAVIWVMGRWAGRIEQVAVQADMKALGLAVAPRRISPRTLAVLYGIGLFTVLPLAVTGVLMGLSLVFGERLAATGNSVILWIVFGASVLCYLAIAAVHIAGRRQRVEREAREAHEQNLRQPGPGSTAAI